MYSYPPQALRSATVTVATATAIATVAATTEASWRAMNFRAMYPPGAMRPAVREFQRNRALDEAITAASRPDASHAATAKLPLETLAGLGRHFQRLVQKPRQNRPLLGVNRHAALLGEHITRETQTRKRSQSGQPRAANAAPENHPTNLPGGGIPL